VVSNAGPDDILWATVIDDFPDEVIDVSWECTAHGPAACPASGAGEIDHTVDLPAGWKVVYQVHGVRDPLSVGHVFTNTVTVVAPPGVSDPDLSNNSASVVNRAPRIYLPIIVKPVDYPVTPDLVVDGLLVSSYGVTVTIANEGGAPVTQPFFVDVYLDPDPAPTAVNQLWNDLAEQGLVWAVTEPALPLAPGDVLTLTVGDAYYFGPYSLVTWPIAVGTVVYAQVDSVGEAGYGAVREGHELAARLYNNILGPVTSVVAFGAPPEVGGELRSLDGLPPRH
jgi:hypothetical protein